MSSQPPADWYAYAYLWWQATTDHPLEFGTPQWSELWNRDIHGVNSMRYLKHVNCGHRQTADEVVQYLTSKVRQSSNMIRNLEMLYPFDGVPASKLFVFQYTYKNVFGKKHYRYTWFEEESGNECSSNRNGNWPVPPTV